MPKRNDIHSVLLIGAGPIVIGQACEFDYSGTQACQALKEEGLRVILLNSNPATIMTDPEFADATYIEPITPETVLRIIDIEQPDAILPTMGGQTALNCVMSLAKSGALTEKNVRLIGADADAIDKAENRERFRDAMAAIGLDVAKSAVVHSVDEAEKAAAEIGYPIIIRPSFTLGGSGGGVADDVESLRAIAARGLHASPSHELLIEESVIGWKEFEMEVVRDTRDQCIIVCAIENLDPMGVHTGDSITVAPAMTLTDKEYQVMRDASFAVLREIGVETGGSNVQFAVNPENGRLLVIEMNPRVSRSSALASKATGFPIARVATKLALGYTLDEIDNSITGGKTPASFEPTIDYVVTKIPRFAFEKFPGTSNTLTTQMKSVGEVMAIGRTFPESLQKALRGLEIDLDGFSPLLGHVDSDIDNAGIETIKKGIAKPTPERILYVAEGLRAGLDVDAIYALSGIDRWFVRHIAKIVHMEREIQTAGKSIDALLLNTAKRMGFSDGALARLIGTNEQAVRTMREQHGIRPVFKRVDTCAGEFATETAYLYSTYEQECEATPSDHKKIMILGGGPNRIGQGIEFDYCCVHAAMALKGAGFETIMVNCNPETVSTDFDMCDKLYFEPLTFEDVMAIVETEQPHGVIVQYGGQTPLKLATDLDRAGVPIIGTPVDAIDIAEDRARFQALLHTLSVKQPQNAVARSTDEALLLAEGIGYPLVVRPSYVLGGRAMEIVHNAEELTHYMHEAVRASSTSPVLLDRFLTDAVEVDIDLVCDASGAVVVGGVMQHIEEAGIHSGDSACVLPPHDLPPGIEQTIRESAIAIARALGVIGLMNAQFAVSGDTVYVLEVNPRASRTVPFVSKAVNVPLAKVGALCMAGITLKEQGIDDIAVPVHISVKESVFPFRKFLGSDTGLRPEMRSTGEVMGIGTSFPEAFGKAYLASGEQFPEKGTVLVIVEDSEQDKAHATAMRLYALGYSIAVKPSHRAAFSQCRAESFSSDAMLAAIQDGTVCLVILTVDSRKDAMSRTVRSAALMQNIPYATTLDWGDALVAALEETVHTDVVALQTRLAGVAE